MIKNNDQEKETRFLKNAREIKQWFEANGSKKPPKPNSCDEEERRLGYAYNNIKQYLLKPYLSLEDDEEKEEFSKAHPGLKEIMEIVYSVDKNVNGKKKVKLAKAIETELKRMVGDYVDFNQEIRSELIRRAKEFKANLKGLEKNDD